MSRVSNGFLWSAIDHFSVQGLQFILSVIIARLVSPTAYGVVVMVQIFMSFAQVFIDGGFKSALIQKKNRTESDFHTVFIFNFLVAIFLYLLLFVAAPYIAAFYSQSQLTSLTRVAALSLIFSSLSLIQLVKLQVSLDFKTQAKARVLSAFISGIIGVLCAYHGFEAWALVIQNVLCTFLTSVLLISFSRWTPRLVFSTESFNKLFGFGSKVLFSNFLTTFYMQVSNLVIGKFYTSTQLAHYNRGFTLSNVPSVTIVEVMGRTIYPIFCDSQNDNCKLIDEYRKYLRLTNFVVLPIMLLVCALSKPLILVLLTDKWIEVAPLLTVFSIAFTTYPYQYITGNFILAVGKSGLLAKTNILKQFIAFLLLLGALFISVEAIAISLMLGNIINVIISVACVYKVKGLKMMEQLYYVLPIFIVSLVSAVLAYIISIFVDNEFISLFAGGSAGIITYITLCIIFKFNEMHLVISILKRSK